MKVIRYTLSGFSAACFVYIIIATIFFSNGFNPIAFVMTIFFGMNAFYLFFMPEISQPSQLMKTLSGYFAFAALELDYRSKIVEETEIMKSAEKSSKALEDSKRQNDRLKAAEEFLKIITMASKKSDAIVSFDQKQISNAQSVASVSAPTTALALSEPAQMSLTSDNITTTAVKKTVSAAVSEKI